MRFGVVLGVMVLAVVAMAGTTLAYQACGWNEIRAALLDGNGAEFVVPVSWTPSPGPEWEQVLGAANFVASHVTYTPDPASCGDQWSSADVTLASGKGDCEDFAILLVSLMRFSIGIPPSRVWVQGGLIAAPPVGIDQGGPVPPIFGHAYVVYKTLHNGIFYIEPQWGGYPYRGSLPSITHWYVTPPYIWGESAMLRFNDAWVRGGGPYLAGPRH